MITVAALRHGDTPHTSRQPRQPGQQGLNGKPERTKVSARARVSAIMMMSWDGSRI